MKMSVIPVSIRREMRAHRPNSTSRLIPWAQRRQKQLPKLAIIIFLTIIVTNHFFRNEYIF